MKTKFVLIFVMGFVISASAHAMQKKSGFFGFTRGCLAEIERGGGDSPSCVTFMTGVFMTDLGLSGFQTVGLIVDAFEKTNDKDKSSSSSSSSNKNSNGPEIPEEKKLASRLSLFLQITDDARDYLVYKTSTPLLESAAQSASKFFPDFENQDGDLTAASEFFLQVEANLNQALQEKYDE